LDWVMQGKITDSLSVIAILRVAKDLGYWLYGSTWTSKDNFSIGLPCDA
jgi:hypothetical protein